MEIEFGGKTHVFPDDIDPVTIETVLKKSSSADWWSTVKSIPSVAVGQTQQSVGGLVQGVGELTGVKSVAEAGAGIAESGKINVELDTPANLTYWKRAALSGGSSVLQAAPGLALSLASGGVAPALAIAGAQAGGQTYGEVRRERPDLSPTRAAGHAAIDATAEALFELLPTRFLLDHAGGPILKLITGTMIREVPTEIATTAVQSANAKISTRPDMTWDEYTQDLLDTIGSVMISAPLTAGMAKVMRPLAKETVAPGGSNQELLPPSTPTTPPPPKIDQPTNIPPSDEQERIKILIDSIDPTKLTNEEVEHSIKETAKLDAARKSPKDDAALAAWGPTMEISSPDVGATQKQGANAVNYPNPNDDIPWQDRQFYLSTVDDVAGKTPGQVGPKPGTHILGAPTEDRPEGVLRATMDTLEPWRQKHLPNATLVISNESLPLPTSLGAHSSATKGIHKIVPGVFRKPKDVREFNPNTEAGIFYTLTHEFGHAVLDDRFYGELDGILAETIKTESQLGLIPEEAIAQLESRKAAVAREFNSVKARILDNSMTAQELVDNWIGPAKAGREFLKDLNVAPQDNAAAVLKALERAAVKTHKDKGGTKGFKEIREAYRTSFFSFDEYMAEQMARHAYKEKWDQTSQLGQYFKDALESLRRFFITAKKDGTIKPGVAFAEWLEGLSRADIKVNSKLRAVESKKKVGKTKLNEAPAVAPAKPKKASIKLDKVEHNVTTSTDEEKVTSGRKLVANLVSSGAIEQSDPAFKELLGHLRDKDFEAFIDKFQIYAGKTVKWELDKDAEGSYIKKPPGGMWHPEAVDQLAAPIFNALTRQARGPGFEDLALQLRQGDTTFAEWTPEELDKDQPVFEWSTKAVKRYLDKYAGTEKDPLKAVEIPAIRGRAEDGEPTLRWEEAWNKAAGSASVKDLLNPDKIDPNWRTRPNSAVWDIRSINTDNPLGKGDPASISAIINYLSHVGDYLRQNVDPAKLQQYDLVRAVKETYANDLRVAKEMEKAAAQSTKDLLVYKDYGDGFKWVELKLPEKLTAEQRKGVLAPTMKFVQEASGVVGKEWQEVIETVRNDLEREPTAADILEHFAEQESPFSGKVFSFVAADAEGRPIQNSYTESVASGRTPEEAWLAGRLAEEGNQMGHCVGGYCEGVASGENRIFSLRDAKGQSHVTVEVQPSSRLDADEIAALPSEFAQDNILQIKGKQNRAPDPKYLPYVQDFVKSGQWGEVGDLGNAELVDIGQSKTNSEPYRNLAEELFPGQRYLNDKEAATLQAEGIKRTIEQAKAPRVNRLRVNYELDYELDFTSPTSHVAMGRLTEEEAKNPKTLADAAREWAEKGLAGKYVKSFFGDWENDSAASSKAVTHSGEPLVLFIAAKKDFTSFELGDVGFHFNTLRAAHYRKSDQGEGVQFVPVILNIRNPIYIGAEDTAMWKSEFGVIGSLRASGLINDSTLDELKLQMSAHTQALSVNELTNSYIVMKPVRDYLISLGYDGIKYNNQAEGDTTWVAFSPEQVKSLLGNKTFSRSKNIHYSLDHDRSTAEGEVAHKLTRALKPWWHNPGPMRRAMRWMQGIGPKVLEIQQLAQIHPTITPLQMFVQKNIGYNTLKSAMMAAADRVIGAWSSSRLSKTSHGKVNKILLDERDGGELWFGVEKQGKEWRYVMTARAMQELKARGVDVETEHGEELGTLILGAKNALMIQLNGWETALERIAMHRYSAGGVEALVHAIKPIRRMIHQIRTAKEIIRGADGSIISEKNLTPFFPRGRFGNYLITIETKAEGARSWQTVHHEAYESIEERNKAWETAVKNAKPDERIRKHEITDKEVALLALPYDFIDLAASELGLSDEEADGEPSQVARLMQILQPSRPDKALKQYDLERLKITGGDKDPMKSFAAFTWHNANLIAKAQYRAEFASTIREIHSELRAAQFSTDPASVDLAYKLQRIENAMKSARDYIMNPSNELQGLRTFVSIAYLGFNVKTALMNFYGLVTTWSDITSRFGQLEGNKLFFKSMIQALGTIKLTDLNDTRKVSYLPPDTQEAFDRAIQEGVLAQNYAYHLAGVSNRGTLWRTPAGNTFTRATHNAVDLSMWLFRLTELSTRRATFIAQFEAEKIKRTDELVGPYDQAVKRTNNLQNAYDAGNRVPFMRGGFANLGPVAPLATIFMSFAQHMAFHAYGGYELGERRAAVKRGETPRTMLGGYTMKLWLVTLLMAGYEGLPGAENILDLIQALWRKFGGDKPIRQYLRETVQSLEVEWLTPGLAAHGLGHDIFGFDISRSIGFGRFAPGTDVLAHPRDNPSEQLGVLALDIMGPFGGFIKFGAEALMSNKPYAQSLERMPGGLGHMYTAYRWSEQGVRSPTGALITQDLETGKIRDLSKGEIVGKALGFNPTIVSENRERRFAQYDRKIYWQTRREMLLDDVWRARVLQDKDAIADSRKAVADFNASIPDQFRSIRVSGQDIQRSMQSRRRNMQKDERGEPSERRYRGIYEDVERSFD